MRSSPSIAPNGVERDVYLVLDDFGSLGRVWRETDEAGTNRVWMVRNLLEGQYENPVRIVAFNIAEGWCRDVTLDIADELRRSYPEFDEVPDSVLKFLETARRHWIVVCDAAWPIFGTRVMRINAGFRPSTYDYRSSCSAVADGQSN